MEREDRIEGILTHFERQYPRKGVNLHLGLHFVGADKLMGRPCG